MWAGGLEGWGVNSAEIELAHGYSCENRPTLFTPGGDRRPIHKLFLAHSSGGDEWAVWGCVWQGWSGCSIVMHGSGHYNGLGSVDQRNGEGMWGTWDKWEDMLIPKINRTSPGRGVIVWAVKAPNRLIATRSSSVGRGDGGVEESSVISIKMKKQHKPGAHPSTKFPLTPHWTRHNSP